ncbi:MAG: Rid family hydrolase [Gaiellaceae bacterium]
MITTRVRSRRSPATRAQSARARSSSSAEPLRPDPGGEILHPGDAYAQTRTAIERALAAAERLGATRDLIVQTRLYFSEEADWRSGVKAHGEIFAGLDPANTTVLVAGLPPEGALVEAELMAWVAQKQGDA